MPPTLKAELPATLRIRAFLPSDFKFILSTWLPGLYHGNSWYKAIDEKAFFEHYEQILRALLQVADIRVACLVDEPDAIVGYSVSRGYILDWVYVKKAWRKERVASNLIPQGITQVSHLTGVGKSILPKGWIFNPFA